MGGLTMRNRVICHLCLAGIMLYLAAGCETTFEQKGRDVKFTASSRGSVSTKTAYGSETNDGYAIIAWEDNDQIRIYSPNTNYLIGSEGSAQEVVVVGEGVGGTTFDYVYDDYKVKPDPLPQSGHIHGATLENVQSSTNLDGRGLYWNLSDNAAEPATFYGVYPPSVGASWFRNGGLAFEVVVSKNQTPLEPQINSLPLLAMQTVAEPSTSSKVNLQFYPAFTAFEFNLKSEDLITLKSFTLETSSDDCYVTGTCLYAPALKGQGQGQDPFYLLNSQLYYIDANNKQFWQGYESCEKSLTIDFPTGTQIGPEVGETPAKEVTFTLFALPNDLDQMSITVNLTTIDGSTKSRKLKLQQKDSNNEFQWITFPAGHKARIKGLAVDKGATWLLDIDGKVLPWNGYDEKIKAQVTLQGKVSITGAIENTYAWKSTVGKELDAGDNITDNHYETDGTYSQFYQVRTLNTYSEIAEADRYFLLTFTPTAPTGGYWELVPTFKDGDTESRNHFKFELEDRPNAGFKPVEMDELNGPILNSIVKIRIIPKNYEWSDPNTYNLWFKYYCRTSKTSAPISGDSEFQDVHRDGRFSYWTFRLGQYEGEFDPSSQAPASGN